MSYDYYDKLNDEQKVRYKAKIGAAGLDQCPYRLPGDCWVNNPARWPKLEYPDVYEYLINTPGVHTKEAMRNRKALEATNQFQSGWVRTVLFHATSKCVILRAEVMPSQRTNDNAHNPWVALTPDALVCTAHCDCMAGLGESCSHVAALLFKVEAAVRLGLCDRACTDEPCRWNNDFVKKVTPSPISEIPFYKEKTKENAQKKQRRPPLSWEPATDAEQASLLDMLTTCEKVPIGLSLFNKYHDKFHYKAVVPEKVMLPNSLRNFYKQDITDVESEVTSLMNIKYSAETINLIEKSTRAQSASVNWKQLRQGRITASIAKEVGNLSLDKPAASTILKVTTAGKDISNVPSVKWGNDHESIALQEFTELVKDNHEGFSVLTPGLRLSKNHHFIGASADGLVTCECHDMRTVEVKCPYKLRDIDSQEELHYCEFLDENLQIQKEHRYYDQIQLQMHVYGTEECVFIVWTPKVMFIQDVKKTPCLLNNFL
ncbi:uncharacterized protein LOC128554195 [Mercenaria mercenaria]|uniref:uncharacterized protein LOC128554195 n=1 Tax=Mercenaria mercenaria TaxID=6596 RepID=UPI00234F9897|nr:uncharacterized protein LOC128554195 [Mercenaria mercenaria]